MKSTLDATKPAIAWAVFRLGDDINRARRAWRMSIEDFVQRMGVGRGTLSRLEKSDPSVSIGKIAAALQALGKLHRLGDLINPATDNAGLMLADRTLPMRVRTRLKRAAPAGNSPESENDPGEVAF